MGLKPPGILTFMLSVILAVIVLVSTFFGAETALFFASLVREDRSVLELIGADYTFVNERLARHYGMPDISGSHFRRVALSADGRWAFVTLQGRNQVATIDLAEGRIAGYLPTGTWSDGVAWSPLAVRR